MNSIYSILLLSMISLGCTAQIKIKSYEDKIFQLCPEATIVEIEVNEDYVEIEYLCNDRFYEVGLNKNFDVLYTETDVEIPSDFMRKIEKKIEKHNPGWAQDEHSMISIGDTSFYQFEIMKNGVEENIYFTLDGKLFRPFNALARDNEIIKKLSESEYYATSTYDFLKPEKVFELPDMLVEISGIAVIDDEHLFCVQDELGAVFRFNVTSGEADDVMRFTDIGDFEDLAVVDDKVYVLRSDGALFHFNYKNHDGETDQINLPVGCLNSEGLFYGKGNIWYVACKEASVNKNDQVRIIHQFSSEDPAAKGKSIAIDIAQIGKWLDEKYPDIEWGNVEFNPSAISIHPVTKEMYVLSATDRLISVFQGEQLVDVFPLPDELYHKPEGLAFTSDGDLYLSSEGMKKGLLSGQIYFFRQK